MAIKAKFQGRDRVMARLRQLVPDAEKEAAKAQAEAARDLAGAIRARAPKGPSGELGRSIEAAPLAGRADGNAPVGIQQTKDPNAQGIFALYIWRFIEFGTRSHSIRPKKKRALAFEGQSGDRVFVGEVSHPGMRAQPFIFPTYRAMRKRIRRKVAGAINKAVRKARGK